MTHQLTLSDPLPAPVLTAARKAMAAAGCPDLADDPVWRERASGWLEKYRRRAQRRPDDMRRRVREIRDWLERVHDNDPARRQWIRIAMIEWALAEVCE